MIDYFINLALIFCNISQNQRVSKGSVASYTIDVSYRMSDDKDTVIEDKALFISADEDIIVYASNKRVSYNTTKAIAIATESKQMGYSFRPTKV